MLSTIRFFKRITGIKVKTKAKVGPKIGVDLKIKVILGVWVKPILMCKKMKHAYKITC